METQQSTTELYKIQKEIQNSKQYLSILWNKVIVNLVHFLQQTGLYNDSHRVKSLSWSTDAWKAIEQPDYTFKSKVHEDQTLSWLELHSSDFKGHNCVFCNSYSDCALFLNS